MNFKKITAAAVTAIAAMAAMSLTSFAAGTKVPLTEKYFPDKNFRKYVSQFDTDENGYLSQKERDAVNHIKMEDLGIKNFKGIQYFTKLERLYCNSNELTKLDLSKNTELVYLECYNNKLTKLD